MMLKYKTEKFYLETESYFLYMRDLLQYQQVITLFFCLSLNGKILSKRDLDNSEDTIIAPEFEIIHEN